MAGLLDGRVAFITGGARGIGLSVAQRFVEEGAAVALADLRSDDAERSAAALGPGAAGVEVDVRSEDSTAAAFDRAESVLGPVDTVVANAGMLYLGHAVDTPADTWRQLLEVNLTGAFLTAREGARRMLAAGTRGRIVFTSSLFGVRGGVENSAYSASKWGMLGLMKCLAAELAPAGITVNAVCPGQIRTPMMEQLATDRAALRGTTPEEEIARVAATIPLGHLAEPTQIADAFVYLASGLSSYTTGQELVVDGGVLVG